MAPVEGVAEVDAWAGRFAAHLQCPNADSLVQALALLPQHSILGVFAAYEHFDYFPQFEATSHLVRLRGTWQLCRYDIGSSEAWLDGFGLLEILVLNPEPASVRVCRSCIYYSRNSYLPCAVNPKGPRAEPGHVCKDFEAQA